MKLSEIAASDVEGLLQAEKSYGDSWKKRGGVGAFMMLARKWDRLERQVMRGLSGDGPRSGDILGHVTADNRVEGLLDDIRDLRRYLILVEAEARARKLETADNPSTDYLDHLRAVLDHDLDRANRALDCWLKRGSMAVFFRIADQWDLLEQNARIQGYNVFGAIGADLDTIAAIRLIRAMLLLVEALLEQNGVVQIGSSRDNRSCA